MQVFHTSLSINSGILFLIVHVESLQFVFPEPPHDATELCESPGQCTLQAMVVYICTCNSYWARFACSVLLYY